MVNGRLIVLVEGGNNATADGDRADDTKVVISKMGDIDEPGNVGGPEDVGGPKDIGGPRVAEDVKVDIITSKSRTSIFLSSYLNIAILSRFTMYQS